jgi:hypothetical protein
MIVDIPTAHVTNLTGFGRTATAQALENLSQALRALELAPRDDSNLCPHPLIIVRAEIENARRYLLASGTDPVRRTPARQTASRCLQSQRTATA